jgi:two-component system chemotaxis response regulator CheB
MIKVLVVDDSLFMRTLISDMLNSDPGIEVMDTAKEGGEAVKKIPKIKPDCITLDLAMPGWDGLATLKHIIAEYPTPVVILSAHSKKDADITIKCLNAGAVSFVLKPSGELSLDIARIKDRLIKEVKSAAKVEIGRIKSLKAKSSVKLKHKLIGINKILVIGASTGGPQTLETILLSLPHGFPVPILIVKHMPTIFFTQSLAKHLNNSCQLMVKVAENNQIIQEGKVYLAPGGFRMTLKPHGRQDVIICLSKEESDMLSASIDLTMKIVAQIYNGNAIGIILSGMGHDGVEGMMAIKEYGGKTIVQDESSVIFGMPKAVIDAGYADEVLPASEMASTIMECVS